MKKARAMGAVEFIRTHLREGISANDVVKCVGYSHPVVGRAFKEPPEAWRKNWRERRASS